MSKIIFFETMFSIILYIFYLVFELGLNTKLDNDNLFHGNFGPGSIFLKGAISE